MSSSKLKPNLDERSTKTLNLTVLQRIDPCIEEILITAAHVASYEFNIDLNKWSRKEVEGSLFVVKRNALPRFQFIVMNRRNTENLVEDLLGNFEFEVQVPYLLYRNAVQEVNGIWFYTAHECEEVADLFGRILGAYSKSKVPQKPQLRKSEYTDHEVVPTCTGIEGPFKPAFTTSTARDGSDDSSFVNFFNTAASIGPDSPAQTVIPSPRVPRAIQSPASIGPNSPAQTVIPSPRVPRAIQSPASIGPNSPPQTVVPSPRVSRAIKSPAPTVQISLPVQSAPSHSGKPINSTNRPANLVKPSFFTPPASPVLATTRVSSAVSSSALYPPVRSQSPHGTPLVQRFPLPTPHTPPTPPPFLTSSHIPSNGGQLTREKVQDALLMLVQDNQFIDLVYQALVKVHHK